MSNSNRIKTVLLIGLILFILSIISMHIAMIFYPGGTFIDSGSVGYIFWLNAFSDLGMTISHSGVSNPIGLILFTISVIGGGIALILIFSVLPYQYNTSTKSKWSSIIGSAFGILLGITYIAIAFAPEDLNWELHVAIAQYLYLATFLTFTIYTIATFWNKDIPLKYTLTFFSITLIVFICLCIFFVVKPDPSTPEGLPFYTIGQKTIHYAFWAGFGLVVYGIWKRTK